MNYILRAHLDEIKKEMNPFVTRKEFSRLLGGLLSPRTFGNLDAKKMGPGVKVAMGRTVAYPREVALAWISERLTIVD